MTQEDVLNYAKMHGIRFLEQGLILPSAPELLQEKIAENLYDLQQRIAVAQANDKRVIYLPGSYDLVHLGHLSYVLQVIDFCIEHFRQQGISVTREDLFLVAHVDSDQLIRHVKSYKHIDNGGEEDFHRPIERDWVNGRHPRLDAMATLPVDCVAFLPFMGEDLSFSLRDVLIAESDDELAQRARAFLEADESLLELWSPAVWSTCVASFINPRAGTFLRVLSTHDEKYLDEAMRAMKLATVEVALITDDVHFSTTNLLKEYSPAELLQLKKNIV